MRKDNPCRDVKKLRERPRKRFMSDEEQLKILDGIPVVQATSVDAQILQLVIALAGRESFSEQRTYSAAAP